jgi:hypothetical protein
MRRTTFSLLVFFTAISAVGAAPVVPTFTTFGPLPGATFGGTGVPNDAVAITSIPLGDGTLTLGMNAFARFNNDAVTNNGAGTFFAGPGANYGTPATPNTPGTPSNFLGSTWNFGYYANITGAPNLSNISLQVKYDFDPAKNTDISQHGTFNLSAIYPPGPTLQDSQNLNFGFLASPSSFITPPPGSFNPNVPGFYTLALQAFSGDVLLGQSAIEVAVGVVPEPASLAIWTIGAGAMLAARRRRSTTIKAAS